MLAEASQGGGRRVHLRDAQALKRTQGEVRIGQPEARELEAQPSVQAYRRPFVALRVAIAKQQAQGPGVHQLDARQLERRRASIVGLPVAIARRRRAWGEPCSAIRTCSQRRSVTVQC